MAVPSDGSYEIPEGLMYSFPVKTNGGNWTIVQGLKVDDFSRGKMTITMEELQQEKQDALQICQKDQVKL